MNGFPIFESIDIDGYQLYPGHAGSGLHARFTKGPWIILGVNGLGKSTLLLLLRYILSGPIRVRQVGFTGERKTDLLDADARMFAVRVADGARDAIAHLQVRFGNKRLTVSRRLDDLSLCEFVVVDAGTKQISSDENQFRICLGQLMGVSDFANVIRILDLLVFYLESREPLIWDVSAQYEIFRALLLSSEDAAQLRLLEGQIISADSAARNLNAALFKITQNRERELGRHATVASVRAELAKTSADLDTAREEEVALQRQLELVETRRSDGRTALWRSERAVDDAAKTYEMAKFDALRYAIAGVPPTDQYVLIRLLAEKICIACGSAAPAAAAELEKRRANNSCLVCGTPRKENPGVTAAAGARRRRAEKAFAQLEKTRSSHELVEKEYREAEESHSAISAKLQATRIWVDECESRTRTLRSRLPQEDQVSLARAESRISALRKEVLNFREEREVAEREIEGLIAKMRDGVQAVRLRLETCFKKRANDFFAEDVSLIYAPRQERIGQQGARFEFPAFEVEMASAAAEGNYARRTIDQVSLSQREYLDIIFRMAVIEAAGSGGYSIVIDGPEGALDAVFADRAGALFADFAPVRHRDRNVLIAACNVVEGGFIPHLLSAFTSRAAKFARIVNLLDVAAPTVALRKLGADYKRAIRRILSQPTRS